MLALTLHAIADEAALFAAVGYLLFATDDLLVDLIYLVRRIRRGAMVYTRFPRAYGDGLPPGGTRGWFAVLIPAWDEEAVIAAMLRATLDRLAHDRYRLFVGVYANDPGTRRAVDTVDDPRVVRVDVPVVGPTTKADCLNHLYAAVRAAEAASGEPLRAIVLHDAEDVVHPFELRLFDALIDRAGAIQIPVRPLIDPGSRWIAGHYADEFAEAHGRDLVVREAIGAAVPLAGVGCAIAAPALAALAAAHGQQPFATDCLTEDYELGLRLGALGHKVMMVRMPAYRGRRGTIAVEALFPATLGAAVRQKARWIGGIAFSGWDRIGWSGSLGTRWMLFRDRRAPMAAMLLVAGYGAMLIWAQLGLAVALGAPAVASDPALLAILPFNAALLIWRMAVRGGFTARHYGWREGCRAVARMPVASLVCVLASLRALSQYDQRRIAWDKTRHRFPASLAEAAR